MLALKVRDMTKKYSGSLGVFNFDIDVGKKDIVLLLGPNGAGKTTAFRGILGLTKVESKTIEILSIDAKENQIEGLKNTGAMVSKPVFYEYLTAYENLEMLLPFYHNVNEESIKKSLEWVGLGNVMYKKVKTFSTGMKQKLDFLRAIIHKPGLLILDEPFNGLDIEAKADLKKRINELQEENNTGIIISSHMVGDLENFANKIVILFNGKTLFNGEMEEVKASGLNLEEFYLEKLKLYREVEV